MFADRAQHDHAHALVLVQRLEHQAELVALRHFDDVERRPVEDDVGALLGDVEFDLEAVERRETRIVEDHFAHAVVPVGASISNSPATSLRRRSLPTGDFGIWVTKM